MSTYTLFPRFPPELRDMIWKAALANEADDRIALVHRDSLRIIPSKCLISPLMTVNRESRKLALQHYNFRLDILRATLDVTPWDFKEWIAAKQYPSDLDGETEWTQDRWVATVWRRTYDAAEQLLNTEPHDGHITQGCIYLNLQSDKFLVSFTYIPGLEAFRGASLSDRDCCVRLLAYHEIAELLGPASLQAHQVPQRHISAKLAPAACRLITSVVYATSRYEKRLKPWPGRLYYPSSTVLEFWMADRFPQMRSPTTGARYRTLEDFRFLDGGFDSWEALVNRIVQEGAKALTFREWQSEESKRDPNGWRIWKPVGA